MSNQRRGNNNEIGAAWIKEGQRGEYISIQLKPEAANLDLLNCFIDMYWNSTKTSDKAPDYRIVAKPKQTQGNRGPAPQQRQQIPRPGASRPQRPPPPSNQAWDPEDGDPGY